MGKGHVLGILRSFLGCARDFACGLKRPHNGSTSTRSHPASGTHTCSGRQKDRLSCTALTQTLLFITQPRLLPVAKRDTLYVLNGERECDHGRGYRSRIFCCGAQRAGQACAGAVIRLWSGKLKAPSYASEAAPRSNHCIMTWFCGW